MLLTQFSIAVTAVCAILGGPIRVDTSQPAPEGPPEINLEPRDKYRKKPNIPDLSVKFWSNQLCQTSYGNSRHYASGDCIGLQWRWKAVSIQRKGNESCHIIRHREEFCLGYSEKNLNLDDCVSVDKPWRSIKFQC